MLYIKYSMAIKIKPGTKKPTKAPNSRSPQRYVKGSGIGSLASMMMPYSIAMLIGWTIFLLTYWALGLPLGIQASYTYPAM